MIQLLRYTMNKDIFITLIRLIIGVIVTFILFVFINSNFDIRIFFFWFNLRQFMLELIPYLIFNICIFLAIYLILLFSYYFLEKFFLLRDFYHFTNKMFVIFPIFGIIYYIVIDFYILKTFLEISYLLLLFQTLQKLHKRQILKLLEYPSLSKAIHIKLLEIKANKKNRLDERKRFKEQLEQKYLDDLNKLNSNR